MTDTDLPRLIAEIEFKIHALVEVIGEDEALREIGRMLIRIQDSGEPNHAH